MAASISPHRIAVMPGTYRAYRLFWLAFGCFLAAVVIGFGWDRQWHTSHSFNDFWSPPHLFIYSMVLLSVLTVAALAFTSVPHSPFGPDEEVPLLHRSMPPAVYFAGVGLTMVGVAGCLDFIWHSSFGLDETVWSTPHALLGWGALVSLLGFWSCRLALSPHRPIGRATAPFIAALLFLFTVSPFTGALDGRTSAHAVALLAGKLPDVLNTPPVLHLFRIEAKWNLSRTNVLYLPLATLQAGVGLALAAAFVRRTRTLLLIVLAITVLQLPGALGMAKYLGLQRQASAWLPVPWLPAILAFAGARRVGSCRNVAWAAAGAVFGLLVTVTWGPTPLLGLLGAPIMLAGARLGSWIALVVRRPSVHAVTLLGASLVCVPLLTGAIDLYLRTHTP